MNNSLGTALAYVIAFIVALEIFKACGANLYDDVTGTNDGFHWYMSD